ncbi:MAG: hypothetical protein ABIJ56_23540 [Pseudomonadota bacterium]
MAGIEKKLLVAVVVPALCLSSCCFASSREAKKLFNEAEDLLEKAQKAEEKSYSDALGLYRGVLDKLETLTTQYGSTRIAKKLLRGDEKVGPFTLDELKGVVVPEIERKAAGQADPDACMRYVIESIDDAEDRARAYVAAAGYHEEAGRQGRAAELLSEALETVKTMEETMEKSFMLQEVADAYLHAGHYDKAVEAAELLDDGFDRATVLAAVAGALAAAGEHESALETAGRLQDEEDRAVVQAAIAVTYAKSSQLDKAMDIAKEIKSPYDKNRAMIEIAGAWARAGKHGKALEAAKTVTHNDDRARVLAEMAVEYEVAGQAKKAATLISGAFAAIEEIEELEDRVMVLAAVAARYARAGREEEVARILARLNEAVDKGATDSLKSNLKSDVLAEIVEAYGEAKHYDRALDTAKAIEGSAERDASLAGVAGLYAGEQKIDTAREVVGLIMDDHEKEYAFSLIAGACIREERFADALELAKTMEYPGFKNNVLARIAAKCAATGRAVDDDLIKLLHDILMQVG